MTPRSIEVSMWIRSQLVASSHPPHLFSLAEGALACIYQQLSLLSCVVWPAGGAAALIASESLWISGRATCSRDGQRARGQRAVGHTDKVSTGATTGARTDELCGKTREPRRTTAAASEACSHDAKRP